MDHTPRIYVADLAAYNNGILHGQWIDATDSVDDILQQITDMLQDSPVSDAEEFAIHDYDNFGPCSLSEYASIESVHEIAAFLDEHPDLGAELLSHFNNQVDEATNALEQYYGCYRSLAEYAQQFTEDTTDIPSHLAYYIDYEAMARDLELSGDIFTIQVGYHEVHVFGSQ